MVAALVAEPGLGCHRTFAAANQNSHHVTFK
jgi:hypothetical protein